MNENKPNKSYLGDGVYAEYDGYGVILTTEDGISVENEIYIDPDVYRSLAAFFTKHLTDPRSK